MMRFVMAGAMALAVTGSAAAAAPAGVVNTSFREPSGERVLQLSVKIQAPPSRVWKGFVDEATLRAWVAPLARVDLRNGSDIEEGYDPKATLGGGQTIHHRIVTYLPERLLVLQNISTPPGLLGAEVYPKILQIVQLEPTPGGGTRVTLSGSGYAAGEAYDRLYGFFAAGNAEYLRALKSLSETPARVAGS